MKKRGFIVSIIALMIIYAVINLIIFLVIPKERIDTFSFWIAWSFAFPVCFIATAGVTYYCSRVENITVIKIPLLYTIQYVFCLIYLISGLVFMVLPIESVTPVWVVEAIISGAYLVLMLYAWSGVAHLSANIARTKKKVFYIRNLQANIDACVNYITDAEIVKMLNSLSEKIRYSDPMSHDLLKESELKLQELISQIVEKSTLGLTEELPTLITKASIELDARNNKCKILK